MIEMHINFIKWSILVATLYFQLFANSKNNSCIDQSVDSLSELRWAVEIFDEGMEEEIGYLLSAGNQVFVVSAAKIISFDSDGKKLWTRARWPKSPVVIRGEKIFFTSEERKSRMQAVDMNNNLVIEDFWMPEVVSNSYLVLFEPVNNGLIAQVQYWPDPDEGEISFTDYLIMDGGLGPVWEKSFDDEKSKVIPIVDIEKQFLVTSTRKEVFVIDINSKKINPNIISTFPLPLGQNTSWLSSDNDGVLYWSGNTNETTVIIATDIQGTEKWSWKSDPITFAGEAIPIIPPIVGADVVYLLTSRKLFAIKNGKSEWSVDSEEEKFIAAVVLNDDKLIVTKENSMLLMNPEGGIISDFLFEENLVTAPVVDEAGHIYAASATKLFAVK